MIRKNGKFKLISPAPRRFVHTGYWKVTNDTLRCYATHSNTDINGEGKKLKDKKIFDMISVNGKIYSVVGQDLKLICCKKE